MLNNQQLLLLISVSMKCHNQLQISQALKSAADKAALRRVLKSHPYKVVNRCARNSSFYPAYARICQNMLDATYSSLCVETVVSELLNCTSVHTQQIGMQSIVFCLAKVFHRCPCGINVNSKLNLAMKDRLLTLSSIFSFNY